MGFASFMGTIDGPVGMPVGSQGGQRAAGRSDHGNDEFVTTGCPHTGG